jgi:hypothetical protein
MPVWGDVFRRAEHDADATAVRRRIEALVEYLATIQARSGH